MIKKYLNHINSKEPHERRTHAMQLAAGVTALALVVWITTLGVRFAETPAEVAAQNTNDTQVASVADSSQGNATLIVSTTTNSGDDTTDDSNFQSY